MKRYIFSIIGLIVLIQSSCKEPETPGILSTIDTTGTEIPEIPDSIPGSTELETNGGIISFTYDDGFDNWYTTGYPLFMSHDYKATFAVNYTWPQNHREWVVEMYNNGFEFASHTTDHNGITDSNVEGMKLLFDDIGVPLEGFIAPNHLWSHEEISIVKKYHSYYAAQFTQQGINTPFDIFHLPRCGLSNRSTASSITEILEYVANNDTWIIFNGHPTSGTWSEENARTDWGQSPELLEFVFNEIQRLGIQVKTVGEVINQYHPLGGTIDCSSNDHQEPDLEYFEEGDPQSPDPSVWNEYWHNTVGTRPGYTGNPVVYCHTSNKDLPVMQFSQSVPNGQYKVIAELIPYNAGTYRVYYSFNASDPSQNSVDISEKTEVDLGSVTVNNGKFNLYTQKADMISGSDGFVGWAFIKLFSE